MYWIPVILLSLFLFTFEFFGTREWKRAILLSLAGAIVMAIVVAVDYKTKTTDTEVWSGYIVGWDHTEEWDEWIPEEEDCTTDSKGKETCTVIPGHWVHHEAENRIKTTDNGWKYVEYMPNGNQMNDNYPNHTSELKEMFPEGTPTASGHRYVNKVQASYSIYKNQEIDLDDYKDLPEYPDKVHNYFYVDRIVGSVPKKEKALKELAKANSYLNHAVKNPENPKKTMSYKQVNLIFVNVGANKPRDYGFALQDSWEGGNKNDFIVAFSMDKKGNISWAYPFSWSESELLKVEVRRYMQEQKEIKDFTPIVKEVAKQVEDKFKRKEFADFNYLQIDVSMYAYVLIWVLSAIIGGVNVYLSLQDRKYSSYYRRR